MSHKPIIKTFFLSTIIVGIILCGVMSFWFIESSQADSNSIVNNSSSPQRQSMPMIMWWARSTDGFEIARLALSSGFFSHVMIANAHKAAGLDSQTKPDIKKIIEFCKQKDIKVVWMRWLYPGGGPGHKIGGFTLKNAYSADYYISQIKNLRKEADELGIELLSFDVEPYGSCPLMPLKSRKLSKAEFEAMNNAINTAIEIAGKVDFVLPSSGESKRHFWNCTRRLGKLTISEYTYYDIPSTHTKRMEEKRPHDIVGIFVDVRKENPYNKRLPLFTPREILERQDLWAHNKGLLIYTANKEKALLVAREFSRIKTIKPVPDN